MTPPYLLQALNSTTERCPVCKAKPGQCCRNTIHPGRPLPGRNSHYARTELQP
jgi:hypothetical protein